MSAKERTKGRAAEAEVRRIYEAHGFTVRGLEGGGDHVCIRPGLVIHSEVKRQETLRLPLWARQALRDAAPGAVPVVAFRRNREPWQALLPHGDLLTIAPTYPRWYNPGYRVQIIDNSYWALVPLSALLAYLTPCKC